MGSVYTRKDSPFLWLKWRDASGKLHQEATRFRKDDPAQLAEARQTLALLERRAAAERRASEGVLTVRGFAVRWLEGLRKREVVSADQYAARLRDHVFPELGELPLRQVRPHHVAQLVEQLREGELAPRTVRHVYGQLHAMFQSAYRRELVDANPCALERHELPKKEDKDPTWRATAVFSREEVELLVSDERLPEERRALYAVMFLAGARIGEALALRWEHYDAAAEPLGQLLVARSWSTSRKLEKSTKTRTTRKVPVHPTLAQVLARWRLSGWAALVGRPPRAGDLLLPDAQGEHRNGNSSLAALHRDLETLGRRPRRQHDARRTFISLALADGAAKPLLRWLTHAPEGVMDEYLTPPWRELCAEVAKLRIRLLGSAAVAPLRAVAGVSSFEVEKEDRTSAPRGSGNEVPRCQATEGDVPTGRPAPTGGPEAAMQGAHPASGGPGRGGAPVPERMGSAGATAQSRPGPDRELRSATVASRAQQRRGFADGRGGTRNLTPGT